MPHLRLEYTDNLEIDTKPLFQKMHQQLADTGAINMKGMRSAAIRLDNYWLADGYEGYRYILVTLTIRGGRPLATRQEFAKRIMATLEEEFGRLRDDGYMHLSVDVREMDKEVALTHHNFPVDGVFGK
ncbi:MAG: 5-carboxymethyl-2-hydroxymuconate Delta-isomerase [Candidatus Promineifilaceae bacterium]